MVSGVSHFNVLLTGECGVGEGEGGGGKATKTMSLNHSIWRDRWTEAGNGTEVLPLTAGPNRRTILWSFHLPLGHTGALYSGSSTYRWAKPAHCTLVLPLTAGPNRRTILWSFHLPLGQTSTPYSGPSTYRWAKLAHCTLVQNKSRCS